MAHAYLLPIKTAAALFPLLAVLLLLPTAVVLYRRHGVMSHGRALSLYGFLYYALTAFCMTVVPLPTRTPDMCARYAVVAHPQWVPGNTFSDIWKEAGHKVSLQALVLQNPAVAGTLFNLLLLLPLGVFLRYHFRRGAAATAGIGLAVSLFFELTQWTGVWGVYACPYRLFDVDDLLVNTGGVVAGWYLAGPVARLLPPLETLDGRALAARPVPFGRRLVALIVDLTGYAAASALVAALLAAAGGHSLVPWAPVGVFVAWFVLQPMTTGATPGKRLLLLRLETTGGGPLRPARLAVRAAMLGVAALPLSAGLFLAVAVLTYEPSLPVLLAAARKARSEDAAALAAVFPGELLLALAGAAMVVTYGLRTLRHPEGLAPHERVSGVRNVPLPHARAAHAWADGGDGGEAGAAERAGAAGRAGAPGRAGAAGRAGAPGRAGSQALVDASSTTVTSGGAPTRTGGPQAPAPRVT